MPSIIIQTFENLKTSKYRLIGIALISIDILLSFLSGLRLVVKRLFVSYQGLLLSDAFSIDKDWSIGEIFQYIKELWLIVLFITLFRRTRAAIYMAWALLFFFLFIDDSLTIHESVGLFIANQVNIPEVFGVSGTAIGELIVISVLGVILLSIIGFSYIRSEKLHQQRTLVILILIVLLAGFGVVIDAFGVMLINTYEAKRIIHIIEDSGEMIVMSLLVLLGLVFVDREKDQ